MTVDPFNTQALAAKLSKLEKFCEMKSNRRQRSLQSTLLQRRKALLGLYTKYNDLKSCIQTFKDSSNLNYSPSFDVEAIDVANEVLASYNTFKMKGAFDKLPKEFQNSDLSPHSNKSIVESTKHVLEPVIVTARMEKDQKSYSNESSPVSELSSLFSESFGSVMFSATKDSSADNTPSTTPILINESENLNNVKSETSEIHSDENSKIVGTGSIGSALAVESDTEFGMFKNPILPSFQNESGDESAPNSSPLSLKAKTFLGPGLGVIEDDAVEPIQLFELNPKVKGSLLMLEEDDDDSTDESDAEISAIMKLSKKKSWGVDFNSPVLLPTSTIVETGSAIGGSPTGAGTGTGVKPLKLPSKGEDSDSDSSTSSSSVALNSDSAETASQAEFIEFHSDVELPNLMVASLSDYTESENEQDAEQNFLNMLSLLDEEDDEITDEELECQIPSDISEDDIEAAILEVTRDFDVAGILLVGQIDESGNHVTWKFTEEQLEEQKKVDKFKDNSSIEKQEGQFYDQLYQDANASTSVDDIEIATKDAEKKDLEKKKNEMEREAEKRRAAISASISMNSSFLDDDDEWESVTKNHIVASQIKQTFETVNYRSFMDYLFSQDLSSFIADSRSRYSEKSGFFRASLNDSLKSQRDFVSALALVPFDPTELEHRTCLQTVYMALTNTNITPLISGSHWENIGFQSSNPLTDFRGTGLLGLIQLLFLVIEKSSVARYCYNVSIAPQGHFPLAITCFNITMLLLDGLRSGDFNRLLNNNVKETETVLDFLNTAFAACVNHFCSEWQKNNYSIVNYNNAKKDLEVFIEKKNFF
eukprot:TRINITY_DN4602_c0_g1_i1.p1 TRINITY_DN4602_c0_g1~~TRINITY_DN4602_c0_g1_i1.p1  ORF type:complete len:819 (-),score=228.65 TRINITY_DN4602_c0_g1_i1:24-2480(-)